MNFLAHLYLSGNSKEIILGNFIADAVKGKNYEKYSIHVQQGIKLHKIIDEYTDSHPIVEKSKERLRNKYHKYSGVIVDMFYDHFLAANWQQYSDKSLKRFTANAYSILIKNFTILPVKTKRILPFMVVSDWLGSYANMNALQKRFEGMERRTTHNSFMDEAVKDLKHDYKLYFHEFTTFFPEIINYIDSKKNF